MVYKYIVVCVGCYNRMCEPCIQRDKFALARHQYFSNLDDAKKHEHLMENEIKSMRQEIDHLNKIVSNLSTKPRERQEP